MYPMSDDRQPSVLGSLPRTRPHRRSDKRPQHASAAEVTETPTETPKAKAKAAAASAKPEAKAKAKAKRSAQPRATGTRRAATPRPGARTQTPAPRAGEPAESHGPVETAVQAAAELAEIGLHASARALRGALSRLPRP
jgi:hypothetical protein